MYLTGSYKHTLDAKGRVTLPAAIRKQFQDTVCLVPVGDAIYGFSPEAHEAWINSYFPDGFNPRNRKDVKIRLALLGSTVTVDLDKAGRLALGKVDTAKLAKRGIDHDVTIVGNADHFEIWDSARYEREMAEIEDDLDALLFDNEQEDA